MPRRIRTLLGTVVMLAFIMAYAVAAMALAESRIQGAPKLVQAFAYFMLGLLWILPLLPLIKWMEGPRKATTGGPHAQ